MSHRTSKRRQPLTPRPRPRLSPGVEGLEGRALMSYGGSPDLTFGTDGYATYAVPSAGDMFDATASAAQADGKLVVVGSLTTPVAGQADVLSFAAARFNADGTLDTSFGTHGYFTTPALSGSINGSTNGFASARGVAIQGDGKIVLAGSVALNTPVTAYAVRLDADGTLDTSFGTGGIVTLGTALAGSPSLDTASSVAVLPGGQVVLGGTLDPSAVSNIVSPAVERLDADGSIDSTFGVGGVAIAPLPAGTETNAGGTNILRPGPKLIAQPDGKIVLENAAMTTIGPSEESVVVTRFAAGGTLDPTFGTAGQEVIPPTLPIASGTGLTGGSIAIQADGKLVVGGTSDYGSVAGSVSPFAQMVAIRLDSDGTPDTTFGVGGADILLGAAPEDSVAVAIAFQADGKILLADGNQAVVARLNVNGLPDTSFGTGGVDVLPFPDGYSELVGVSVLAGGKIVAAQGGTLGNATQGLFRLIPKGASGDYNDDGISDPAAYDTTTATFTDVPSGGGTPASIPFGATGAGNSLPVPGAYSGGGITELAVFLPGPGAFVVRPYAGGADVITAFGTPGVGNALPAPGDYDSSGQTELGYYSPISGEFVYRRALGGQTVIVPLGVAGAGKSIPAEADYFGTGQDDFAVYLVTQGAYQIKNPISGDVYTIPFGTAGAGRSIPVPGDYDGSGHAELAVYVPASGDLIYRPANGGADVVVPIGTAGVAQSIPAIGDYDGSGHDEAAVYEPAAAMFTYIPSSGGPAVSVPLGTANQAVPFSMGTNSVAESGLGGSGSPGAIGVPAVVPLTQDVLDAPAGSPAKKKAAIG